MYPMKNVQAVLLIAADAFNTVIAVNPPEPMLNFGPVAASTNQMHC